MTSVPLADGLQRGLSRLGVGVRALAYLRDRAAVRPEPLQHGQLVRLAASHQVLETEVELPHLAQRSAGRQQVQPRPVLARHEVGDVTRRQPQPFTSELHPAPPVPGQTSCRPVSFPIAPRRAWLSFTPAGGPPARGRGDALHPLTSCSAGPVAARAGPVRWEGSPVPPVRLPLDTASVILASEQVPGRRCHGVHHLWPGAWPGPARARKNSGTSLQPQHCGHNCRGPEQYVKRTPRRSRRIGVVESAHCLFPVLGTSIQPVEDRLLCSPDERLERLAIAE